MGFAFAGLPQPEGMALAPGGVRPMYQLMMDMARVYGDKFGVVSYGERVVVLQSPELLREVLIEKGEAPLGRIPFGNTPHVNPLKLGTVRIPEKSASAVMLIAGTMSEFSVVASGL